MPKLRLKFAENTYCVEVSAQGLASIDYMHKT